MLHGTCTIITSPLPGLLEHVVDQTEGPAAVPGQPQGGGQGSKPEPGIQAGLYTTRIYRC